MEHIDEKAILLNSLHCLKVLVLSKFIKINQGLRVFLMNHYHFFFNYLLSSNFSAEKAIFLNELNIEPFCACYCYGL